MSINEDIQLDGQQSIPTHPADPAARGEADKVVGDAVPHSRDYNDPPPEGAVKSTGEAADPGVGGALGEPPQPARGATNVPGGDSDTELGEAQGGGDELSDGV